MSAAQLLALGAVGFVAVSHLLAPRASGRVMAGPGQVVNRDGDVEDEGNLRPSDWIRRWEHKKIGWHKKEVNPFLLAQLASLTAQPTLESHPSILVPLCGKTCDLLYLWERGFHVVGIEFVAQAIHEFFEDNSDSIGKYTVEHIKAGNGSAAASFSRFSTPDGRLTIVRADIFSPHLTKEILLGTSNTSSSVASASATAATPAGFDVVWDRASLVALNPHTRQKYCAAINSWTAPTCEYLLQHCEYDTSLMHGPPFSITEQDVHTLFASNYPTRTLVTVQKDLQQFNGVGKPTVPYANKIWFMKNTTSDAHRRESTDVETPRKNRSVRFDVQSDEAIV